MSGTLLEGNVPTVQYNGLQTNKATVLGSTLSVAGATTLTGAVTAPAGVTGPVTAPVVSGTAGVTITAADSGTTYFSTKTSSTQAYVLPTAAAGLKYTFIAAHAGTEILIDQPGSETIVITSFAAVGADADTGIVAPAGGTGIKNTAASNAVGDSLTLISDGTNWYGVGITSGIWASQ